MDSLNALILMNRKRPGILADGAIEIDILDVDEAGPAFGESALVALSQPERTTARRAHCFPSSSIQLGACGGTRGPVEKNETRASHHHLLFRRRII